MLGTGGELLGKFTRELSSCLLVPWGNVQGTGEKDLCLREKTYTQHTVFLPPSECHTRCSDTEVPSFWCFLLADSSVGVQTAARVPFCPSLQESTGNQWEGVSSWRVRLRTKTSQVNRLKHVYIYIYSNYWYIIINIKINHSIWLD